MEMIRIRVREATKNDIVHIDTAFSEMGWAKPEGYFAGLVESAAAGDLCFLIAETDARQYAGHLKIVWRPAYAGFRDEGIPEIQDLNVLPRYRRRGVATRLMDAAEELIRGRCDRVGIGFGLYADYGAAQRMYVKRGYLPDGRGAMVAEKPVVPGGTVKIDDELILYLIKELEV
jgi:GNAT superfamily N-acetyltransferase